MSDSQGINSFIVEGGGRKMQVIIPKSNDKSYDAHLIEAEKEKTKKQLEANPRPKSTKNKEEVSGALREYKDFQNRKKSGTKKYF